ncbi:MAG: hypothetical protein AAGF32_07140 [Pseudomonadota bacterium]
MPTFRALIAFAFVVMAAVSVLGMGHAQAGKLGTEQALTAYAQTKLTDGENGPVALCYLTETVHVIAPFYTSDRMVLCHAQTDRYWEMSETSRMSQLQAEGFLPDPLPSYSRPWWDIALGFCGWLGLILIVWAEWYARWSPVTRDETFPEPITGNTNADA